MTTKTETTNKPSCKLTGQDGNIFCLIGLAARALRRAGQEKQASEMSKAVMSTHSYSDALAKIAEYVDVY